MRTRWRLAVLVALMGAVLSLLQVPASAAPAGPDPAVAAALARIATDTHTAADLALIKSQPELSKVADPDRTKIEVEPAQPLPGTADAGINAECCYWARVTVTVYTVLGFELFKWSHYVEFCINNGLVSRWLTRYDQMLYADPTIYVRDLVVNSVTATPAYSSTSTMQRHLEQCVIRYGCYANWYPWAWMRPQGNYQLYWNGGSA